MQFSFQNGVGFERSKPLVQREGEEGLNTRPILGRKKSVGFGQFLGAMEIFSANSNRNIGHEVDGPPTE